MGRISDEKIEEIKHRVDIVEIVSGYLPLRRSGVNHLGLCPFHQEKSPSFNVNSARQIFHCFGCGAGGNVFTFLMRMESISFPEAVKRLGDQVGIEVLEESVSPEEKRRKEQREEVFRVNLMAADFFHHVLLEGEDGASGRRYLRQRGYDADTVRAFQLGFAKDDWDSLAGHLREKGVAEASMRQAGLVRPGKQGRGDYDLFRNRLMFPIHDQQGRLVAFGGRVLDDSLPKYINSPESPVYHKGQILYGLFQARDAMRQTNQALVVEGYFDVLALHRAGFDNCVATCGTALTIDHARVLKRFADKVLLVFDQDEAGQLATFRAMDALLPAGLAVYVLSLPVGADPDSLIQEQGSKGFQECLDSARPALEAYMEHQLNLHDATIEGRVRASEQIMSRIRRLPSDLERHLYVKRLAEMTRLDESLLLDKIRGNPKALRPVKSNGEASGEKAKRRLTLVDRSQLFLLRLMTLPDSKIRARVREESVPKLFLDELHRSVADYLLAVEDEHGNLPKDLVHPSLSEPQQALLAGLVLEESTTWGDEPERIFEDCRRAVRRGLLTDRLLELEQLEERARQDGDDQALMACLQERVKINAEIKKKL